MKKLVITVALLFASLFLTENAFAYTVKNGDTMSKIARENNLTLQELVEMNPQIQDTDTIHIGDSIQIEKRNWTSSIDIESITEYEIYAGRNEKIEEPNITISLIEKVESAESITPENPPVKTQEVAKPEIKAVPYSEKELDLLARLVRAEAQIEPFEGKVAVACVVLNRVESSLFPDSIKEVIYEARQFQPVSNGEINKPADAESIAAVEAALSSQRHLAQDSLFFYNPQIATSRWLDTRATTLVIGQHVFKK